MDGAPLRPVLQDISARLINPHHQTGVDVVSAFKSIMRGGPIRNQRRRSSSVNEENFLLHQCILSNEGKSVPNLTVIGTAMDLTTSASSACTSESHLLQCTKNTVKTIRNSHLPPTSKNVLQSSNNAIQTVRKSHLPQTSKNTAVVTEKSDLVDCSRQTDEVKFELVEKEGLPALSSNSQSRNSSTNAAVTVDVEPWTARFDNSAVSDSLLRDEIKSLCHDKLMATEERNQLQQENELLKSRIRDLELSFAAQKTLFENTEANLSLEVISLQQRIIHLQNDVALAHQETTDQCRMYKESYHGAVQSMHELQAQLDQYSNLKQSIEEALGGQQRVTELFKKAHGSLKAMRDHVSLQREELDAEKEQLLHRTREYEQAINEFDDMVRQKNELTSQFVKALDKVKSLELALVSEQQEKAAGLLTLQAKEQQVSQLQQESNELSQRHEQEVDNLKKSLKKCEHDTVELSRHAERLQQLVTYQKKELSKSLVAMSHSQELSQNLKSVEAELKDAVETKDLLDQERSLLMAELEDARAKLEHCSADNLSLSNQIALLKGSNQHLETELDSSANSLANLVRELVILNEDLSMQADHWMKVASLSVNDESGDFKPVSECLMSASKSCVSVQQLATPSSFIQLVLNAAETCPGMSRQRQLCITDSAPKRSTSDGPSLASGSTPKTPSRELRSDIQSTPGFSAFRSLPVRRTQRNLSVNGNLEIEGHSREVVIQLPGSANQSYRSSQSEDNHSLNKDLVNLRLTGSLNGVLTVRATEATTLLVDVRKLMKQLQESIGSTISNLRSHLAKSNSSLKEECAKRDLKILCAREALRASQLVVSENKQTADKTLRELTAIRQENITLKSNLKQVRCQLAQRADSSVLCYELTLDNKKLQKELVERNDEISTLKETIQSRLAHLDSESGQKSCLTRLLTENHRLLADKTKLLDSLSEQNTMNTAEACRLREMCKLSTTNLKRAELALSLLNDKVERVRQALRPHAELLKKDEKMLVAMNEIKVFADD